MQEVATNDGNTRYTHNPTMDEDGSGSSVAL